MDLKYVDPYGGNIAKINSKSPQIFILKIAEIEPPTWFKVFFQNEMPLVIILHHFSYLSLH
jgi:hypothetical protein